MAWTNAGDRARIKLLGTLLDVMLGKRLEIGMGIILGVGLWLRLREAN